MTDAALSLFHIASRWDPLCTPFSSTNKTDRQYITEIYLKVALNTVNHPTKKCTGKLEIVILSSLKQQCAGRHVTQLRHIFLIPSPPVFV